MSKIEIKINHTKSVNKQIKQLSSKLTDSKVSISMLRNHVDSQVAQRRSIGPRLNDAITRINASEKRMQDLYQCIEHSMDLYIKAEKRVQSLKLAEVEKKSIWDTVIDSVKGFGKGLGTAVVSTVEGIWYLFNHPVETIKGTIHVITHPVETGKAIWKAISDSWKKDVVNGDAESRSHWFGRAFGEVALAIVGTKGVDKGVKLLKGSEVLSNEVGGVRIGRSNVDSFKKPDYLEQVDRIPSYEGIKEASEFLKTEGVPRAFRKQVLQSFETGTIRLDIADDNTYGLRFYDNVNASAKGRYLYETFTDLTNRKNLSLPPEWNGMTGIQQWQIRPGTIIIKGNAGPQFQYGSEYIGGMEQWYINNLDNLIKPRNF